MSPLLRLATSALVALLLSSLAVPNAHAATIVWDSPQTISGDSDVITRGSLVYAYNFGPSNVTSSTVNGVPFSAFAFPSASGFSSGTSVTVGSVTFSEFPGDLIAWNTLGSGSAPYANLSPAYRGLLDSCGASGMPSTVTLLLGGLTNGQEYAFQWWASNAVLLPPFVAVAADATNAVTLDSNLTNAAGGLGQFVVGTFTADGVSQSIDFNAAGGGFGPMINAFQIRAVPEPSTYAMALAGIACGGFSMWRRRRA
ncbi:MAG: PEP-CTERM sorting domain-containing protein [Planctomycetaceae bacterium]